MKQGTHTHTHTQVEREDKSQRREEKNRHAETLVYIEHETFTKNSLSKINVTLFNYTLCAAMNVLMKI